jgi:hypothetical protein
LETVIRELFNMITTSEQMRLKRMLEPDRYIIEVEFVKFIQLLHKISRIERNEAGPLSPGDAQLCDGLKFERDLSGRPKDYILMKLLDLTNEEYGKIQSTLEQTS